MPEENEQNATTEAQQPEAQQVQNNAIANEAANVLGDLGSFLTEADRAELQKLSGEKQSEQKQAAEAVTENEDSDQDEQNNTEKSEGEEKKEPEVKATETKKGLLGLNKKKTEKEVTIENPEQLLATIKSKYGQEYKDIKELPKFFESVDKMRASSQKLDKVQADYELLEKAIQELPTEFHEAFNALRDGEDYTKPFLKNSGIDYNKPAEKQDIKSLVAHYFPGKFNDEEFSEEEKSQALTIAQEASLMKFNSEKSIHDNKRADTAAKTQKVLEAQKSAAASSVKSLQERFPEMDGDAFNQVKSLINGGADSVRNFFFNNDGTAKPDAGIKLTLALFGETELLPDAMEVAAHIAETKKNEELLTRGADGPKPHRGGGQPEQIPAEIKKRIDEMTRITEKSSKKTY